MSAKKCITCTNRFAINLRNLNNIGELTTYSYEKERGLGVQKEYNFQ